MVYEPRWDRLRAPKVKADAAEAEEPEIRPQQSVEDTSPKATKANATLLVQEMRGRGLSAQTIATTLQARKVPRPDGKPWTGHMVRTILGRIRRSPGT